MRTKYSMLNMMVNILGQILNVILAFISRMVLVHFFTVEYLGISSLFGNILNLLSLSELGIGIAMVYSMYAPAAAEDQERLLELFHLYRRLYRIVALVVAVCGMALLPFLDILVKESSQIEHLHFYYLLFLSHSVCSYLFAYKTSLITVHQKQYIVNLYTQTFVIIRYVLQILFLYITRNFTLYLMIQIGTTITSGYLAARRAEKMYPYIKEKSNVLPPEKQRRAIYKNIGAMSLHKIGEVLINYTDNLILSAFIGLSSVGIYSNYKLISSNLEHFVYLTISSVTASVGNLGVSESRDKIYDVYKTLNFLGYACYSYSTALMGVLFTPFIRLAFGNNFLLPASTVLLILADFYMRGMRQVTQCFRDGMGIFWNYRYKSLVEAFINLTVSLCLVGQWGITGVLTGTVVSFAITSFWIEPMVLLRYGIKDHWKRRLLEYFIKYIGNTAAMCLCGLAVWLVCSIFPMENLGWIILGGVAGSGVYFFTFLLIFGRTREFRNLKETGYGFFKLAMAKVAERRR